MRHFGPMHGEKTRRHQMTIASSRDDDLIVSVYELEGPRLAVEYYRAAGGVTAGHLTVDEAKALREALAEFITAWDDDA